jgi:predicted phage-related endonuclease
LSGEYLGASEVNVIMTQRNRSAYNLAQEKVGIIPRKEVDNIYTRYGNEMEPLIINEIEKQGCRFMTEKRRCHEYKLSGVLDGIDYERNIILEVKTFTYIPDMQSYLNQIHVYFHIFKMEKAILALYQRNEHFDPRAIELYNISIDKQRLENILTAVRTFWSKAEILRNNPEMKKKQFDALEAK